MTHAWKLIASSHWALPGAPEPLSVVVTRIGRRLLTGPRPPGMAGQTLPTTAATTTTATTTTTTPTPTTTSNTRQPTTTAQQ